MMGIQTDIATAIDLPRLQSALDLLQRCSHEGRLLQLKNLVLNNGGIWTVPEAPCGYTPVLYEAQLFGVPAFADRDQDLPVNWMRAARNLLDRQAEGVAA